MYACICLSFSYFVLNDSYLVWIIHVGGLSVRQGWRVPSACIPYIGCRIPLVYGYFLLPEGFFLLVSYAKRWT